MENLNLEEVRDKLIREGWYVNAGTKFGADLLISDRYPSQIAHPKYALYLLKSGDTWRDIIGHVRVAASVGKEAILVLPTTEASSSREALSSQSVTQGVGQTDKTVQPFTLIKISQWNIQSH